MQSPCTNDWGDVQHNIKNLPVSSKFFNSQYLFLWNSSPLYPNLILPQSVGMTVAPQTCAVSIGKPQLGTCEIAAWLWTPGFWDNTKQNSQAGVLATCDASLPDTQRYVLNGQTRRSASSSHERFG